MGEGEGDGLGEADGVAEADADADALGELAGEGESRTAALLDPQAASMRMATA